MAKTSPNPRIFISRTENEWTAIEKRLEEMNLSNFNSYLNSRISLLQKKYKESPSDLCTSIGKRVQREYSVNEKYFKILNIISVKTSIPVSTIVDRTIIEPLIINNK